MLQKRQEFKEKTKGALVFSDMPNEKKGKGRGRKADTEYVSDSGSGGDLSGSQRERLPKQKSRQDVI